MFRVIEAFTDRVDGRLYRPGDTYPREVGTADAARLRELSGRDNSLGRPLIEAVADRAGRRVKRHDA